MKLIWVVLSPRQPRWIEVRETGLLLALRDRQELIPWGELAIEERMFWHVFPAVHIALRNGEAWVFKDYIGFDVLKSLCNPPEDHSSGSEEASSAEPDPAPPAQK